MDSLEIHSLFNDQQSLKKYVKKDLVRVYDSVLQPGANRVKFTCHTLVNKLIDYSEAFIIFDGYISSSTGTALANGNIVSIQNGTNSLFADIKLSFNNNEVEHNRRPDISTTWLNLLELSPDYAGSLGVQWGFVKDLALNGGGNDDVATLRMAIGGADLGTVTGAGGGLPARFVVRYIVPLKYISQFCRRLTFPIINQLVELELALNHNNRLIFRRGAQASQMTMTGAQLLAPEVVLPTSENTKLMKEISSGKFVKELEWDSMDYILTNTQVTGNNQFEVLLGTNLTGVKKLLFMVHGHVDSQQHVQTGSEINVRNFNVEIDSKDLYNMNVATDQEAYRLVSENFNSQGKDVNTGSLLPYTDWLSRYRLYAVDLSRQEIFESDPNVVQTIRLRGTPSANGQLIVVLAKNRKTRIDFANPQNTKTI